MTRDELDMQRLLAVAEMLGENPSGKIVRRAAAEIERLRASLKASVEVQMKLSDQNEELIRGMTEMAERFTRAMAPHLPQS